MRQLQVADITVAVYTSGLKGGGGGGGGWGVNRIGKL